MKYKILLLSFLILLAASCKEKVTQTGNKIFKVAETPPMDWNSYNCYGAAVSEKEMMDNALMMSVHLKEYGWQYVVVDYCWFYPFPGAMNNPPQTQDFKPGLTMDGNGRLLPSAQAEHVRKYANMWRISADFWDEWASLKKQFELCNKWSSVSGPDRWPDADMLTLGRLNLRGPNPGLGRMTNFTQEEQKTLMTLWSIFRSPLMMGGDLITLDNYTLILLTNSEVIQVNQKSENNRQLFRDGVKIAWVADVPGSSDKYLALFYTGDLTASELTVNISGLGFNGSCTVRDLWNHIETGTVSGVLKISLPAHGSGLYKVRPI